jgi:uncharacterized MAPEG superfamily protein
MSTAPRSRHYPRWAVPAFTLFLGGLVFAAQAIGGDAEGGAISFAVLAAVALVLLIGGRSETVQLIRQPDERWLALRRAYVQLCALAGLAYIGSMVWLRFHG